MTMAILVTGASRGLGLELVRHLIETVDDTIVCVSRTLTPEIVALMSRHASRLAWLESDLRDPYAAEREIDGFLRTGKFRLRGLVNNAGMFDPCLITNVTESRLSDTLCVNLIAPMLLSKLAIRNFLRHGIRGSMVHVSSVAAHCGFNATSVYAASKGGLEAFSRSVAAEWGSRGIRSNVVSVGLTDIGMSRVVEPRLKDLMTVMAPLKSTTKSVSVAGMIGFLLSDGACSITAQNIHVNSGVYPT